MAPDWGGCIHANTAEPADGWQLCLSRAAALVDHTEPDRHLQVEALALGCHLNHPVNSHVLPALIRRFHEAG